MRAETARLSTASFRRKAAFVSALMVGLTLLAPLPKAKATHDLCVLDVVNDQGRNFGTGNPLFEIDPSGDVDSHAVGDTHAMQAFLIAVSPDPTGQNIRTCIPTQVVNIDFENEAGPNDNDGISLTTPDLTCDISPTDITASCTVSYVGTLPGTDIWRTWIDHDKIQGSVEADQEEGVNETQRPGTGGEPGSCPGASSVDNPGAPEPDCTDVTQASFGSAASRLDCDDANGPNTEIEFNPSGAGPASTEPYTCRVTNPFGQRRAGNVNTVFREFRVGAEIENSVNDPDPAEGPSYASPDYSCGISETGDNVGECVIEIPQADNENGTAHICFFFFTGTGASPSGNARSAGETLCAGSSPAPDPFPAPNSAGDPEPTLENANPDGSDEPNDFADAVELTWAARAADQVDAEPESQAAVVGSAVTLTATVFDQFGNQIESSNRTVFFEFFVGSPTDRDGNTPETPDLTCTPGAAAACTVSWSGPPAPGTDLVCVWINDPPRPSLTGNNVGGQCDGEGLNDEDDDSGVSDPQGAADDQDVVQVLWQTAAAATRLDCTPETTIGSPNSLTTFVCTARSTSGELSNQTNIDVEAVGANDPDNGNTPLTPDFTCTTGSNGTCSFDHGPSNTSVNGVTTYRAWIDADKNNQSTEADPTEARDEVAAPGTRAEPDETDVVERTWGNAPNRIELAPKNDAGPVGSCRAFTATVFDGANNPLSGFILDVEQRHQSANNASTTDDPTVAFCTPTDTSLPNVSGVDVNRGDLRQPEENPDNPATLGGEMTNATDSTGRVTFGITVTGNSGASGNGAVDIIVFYESTDNDDADPEEPQDRAIEQWGGTIPPTGSPSPTTTTSTAPPVGPYARNVTLSSNKSRRVSGGTFTLSGNVTSSDPSAPASCTSGVRVTIRRDETGDSVERFNDFASATTVAGGTYSVNIKADVNAVYVAHVQNNSPQGCSEATSSSQTVLVSTAVRMRLSKKVIARGRSVRLAGRLIPCEGHADDTVVLFGGTGTNLRRIASQRVGTDCTYRFSRRLTRTTSFQARWAKQDQDHEAGQSRRKTVRVR
ncbi:MAG TPA: hypothetical protein VNC78_08820 [Actinomycetota bacterium]|nr:hypothetical protein [Actinomycetota bacterium]